MTEQLGKETLTSTNSSQLTDLSAGNGNQPF